MHKQVTGEKWIQQLDQPTTRQLFQPQTGKKNMQPKVPLEIRRRDVFVLRLRPHYIPKWQCVLHLYNDRPTYLFIVQIIPASRLKMAAY
jgi:hypothetical protein